MNESYYRNNTSTDIGFGPEVAAAAEKVLCYLDYVLDQELMSRNFSEPA